ncbi:MAG: homoserine dehydrogenase [Desulfobacteraceae bacterium]|nr:homoserine dehydrogenase [Desulfobacteraceae bacterium]
MKNIKVGLLGCGTVGTGVAKMLLVNGELIQKRLGTGLELKYVADTDTRTDRGIDFADGVFVDDAFKVVADPEVDIIIEMIGGESVAKALILQAFENGKHVVTANKALLAKHGNELVRAAAGKKVDLAYEASVGGCMPIIKTLREALIGNNIAKITGILNGTCNYILTKITNEGISFEEALADAQTGGYAEADPGLDVDGLDAAHKLAILGALAYGMRINFDDIYIEGISKITPLDIQFAGQFGYRIKLLAISKNTGEKVEARVHPTMIPVDNILSNVDGTLNAVSITGDAVGEIFLSGHGAGMMPTASAVISDTVDIARNLLSGSRTDRIPTMGYQAAKVRKIPVMSIDELVTHYYFRFEALDEPGVLSKISGILGDFQISLKTVHQMGRRTNGSVPVVMLTHYAREADVKNALAEINGLNVVENDPVVIRIEDKNNKY